MSAGLPLADDGAESTRGRTVNSESAAPAPARRKCRRDNEFFMVNSIVNAGSVQGMHRKCTREYEESRKTHRESLSILNRPSRDIWVQSQLCSPWHGREFRPADGAYHPTNECQ